MLLPDFIGHPSCFRELRARLPGQACQPVNYHHLEAYDSIEALAERLLTEQTEPARWLIGYSFGGVVGYEMACRQPRSCLLMIDSHLPWPALRQRSPEQQYQQWLSADMREWIAAMSELGEVREQVLLRNIELFSQWQPRQRLARAWTVQCDDAMPEARLSDWRTHVDDLQVFPSQWPHHLALKDPRVMDFISHTVSKEFDQ